MDKKRSEKRTLLMSVLMSAPGPAILAFGLMAGRSSTQIADFLRRSAELLALVMTYVTYLLTADGKRGEAQKKQYEHRANLFTGSMMCLGGTIMLVLALFSGEGEKGSVVTGLIVAVLGVIANTLFWRKYTRLNQAAPNPMIAVQARLYRAKSLVDGCVVMALLSVQLFPGSLLSFWLDKAGSAVVAVYLSWCGFRTVRENM